MKRLRARDALAGARLAWLNLCHRELRGSWFFIGPRAEVHVANGAVIEIGRGTRIMSDSTLSISGRLRIGANVFVNRGVYISAAEDVFIGDDCLLGERVSIHDNNHRTDEPEIPLARQGFETSPITIGRNVWLCANVAVLSGVTIGDNAVVAAGAVVTQDVPAGAVVAGIPARRIR
jgi:acetyltransferase-like isoleucine patch superfamily enzyme